MSRGWRESAAALAALGLGAAAAHGFQRQADEVRLNDPARFERIYVPDGGAVRVASMGYHTLAADVMWVRAVLAFAQILDDQEPGGCRWLHAMLESVSILDPTWRTVYFYGGGMLRLCGDIDGSDALYLEGMAQIPEDYFFPFSLAMNAYLYRQDLPKAAEYLHLAAEKPDAPPWYRAAAAGFLQEGGQRQAAMRYLKEQLEAASSDNERRAIQGKLNALVHDELAERIEEQRAAFQARFGRDAVSLGELGGLPADPYGEGWILAPDGRVRSAVVERDEARRAQAKERAMLLPRPGQARP